MERRVNKKVPITDEQKTLISIPIAMSSSTTFAEKASSEEDLFEFMRETVGTSESGALGDNEQTDDTTDLDAHAASSSSQLVVVASTSTNMTKASLSNLVSLVECNEFANMLMRMGEEGDGDANQIVMELLNSRKQVDRTTSVLDRVSDKLMLMMRGTTLIEAGIFVGNERYFCFKTVLQNYAKLYAAKRFIDKLPSVKQELATEQEQESEADNDRKLLARVLADDVLQLPELLRQLSGSLEKMEFFNEDTAFKVYLEARRHPQAKILRELMLTRISRVFLCIVSSNSFLDFTEQELIHMLKNSYLSVNSEIEIFLSVILWLEHNWFQRKLCAERVMSGVRFSLMPTWYLSTLHRTNRCHHFARVIYIPGVQAMLDKGLEDAVAIRGKNSRFSTVRKVETPLPRDWIADPECRHHHKCHCDLFIYPTYDVFKEYLARIIRCAPNYWRTLRPAQEVYRNELMCCSPLCFN